jgi:hypothetical protein
MCGSLRRENNNHRMGNPEPSYIPGSKVPMTDAQGNVSEGYWNGHARSETLEPLFINKGWKPGYLNVAEYTEGHKGNRKVYAVPSGQRMKIIYRDIPGRGRIFNIVTREARGKEIEVHPRFPLCE